MYLPMDRVSIEGIGADHIREHYRRLGDFKGLDKEDFRAGLRKRLAIGA